MSCPAEVIVKTDFKNLPLLNRGKVRDIYDLGDKLLMVATDRISAFDVILPDGIPNKGKILNQLSAFWFCRVSDITHHHLITTSVEEFPTACQPYRDILEGRSMVIKKAAPIPVECVVRGYLSGSGWSDYQKTGTVCGLTLPKGLTESSPLEKPIFTPAIKAKMGTHDENIPFERVSQMVGRQTADRIRNLSFMIYGRAKNIAESCGIIIADTKMEFGSLNGEIILIDELLTPDSSRFWPMESYSPGRPQESFDKQFVRNFLLSINWNKKPPAPKLPKEIIAKTTQRYLEAYRRLTGKEFTNSLD